MEFEIVSKYPFEHLLPFGRYSRGDTVTISVEGKYRGDFRVVDVSGDVIYFEKIKPPPVDAAPKID